MKSANKHKRSIVYSVRRRRLKGCCDGVTVTYVFEAEQLPPAGFLRSTAESASELWSRYPDPLAQEAVEAYFRHHYWRHADRLALPSGSHATPSVRW